MPFALLLAAAAVAGLIALGGGGDDGASREGRSAGASGAADRAPADRGAADRAPADRGATAERRAENPRRPAASGQRERARRTAPSSTTSPAATTQAAPAPSASENPVALNDRGFERIRAGDYATAVRLLRRSVAAFRAQGRRGEITYAYALYNLGQALNRSGRPADAIPYLEERLKVSDFKRDVVKAELKMARAAAKG